MLKYVSFFNIFQETLAGVVLTNKTTGLGHQCFPLYRFLLNVFRKLDFLNIEFSQPATGVGQP